MSNASKTRYLAWGLAFSPFLYLLILWGSGFVVSPWMHLANWVDSHDPVSGRIAKWHLSRYTQCPRDGFFSPFSVVNLHSEGHNNADTVKQAVDLLIEKGCDINEPFRNGYTPLHAAVMNSDTEMVTFLLSRGADPTIEVISSITDTPYAGDTAAEMARKRRGDISDSVEKARLAAILSAFEARGAPPLLQRP